VWFEGQLFGKGGGGGGGGKKVKHSLAHAEVWSDWDSKPVIALSFSS